MNLRLCNAVSWSISPFFSGQNCGPVNEASSPTLQDERQSIFKLPYKLHNKATAQDALAVPGVIYVVAKCIARILKVVQDLPKVIYYTTRDIVKCGTMNSFILMCYSTYHLCIYRYINLCPINNF